MISHKPIYHLLSISFLCLMMGVFYSIPSYTQAPVYRDSMLVQVRAELEILSGQKFAGRGYTRNGHTLAANYIKQQFEHYGLQTQLQPFPLNINLASSASLKINKASLQAGADFINNKLSGAGKVSGKIYDAGYGLFPSAQARDKVLLMRAGWPVEIANDADKQQEFRELKDLRNRMAAWAQFKPKAILVVQQKLTAGFAREAFPFPILEIRADALPSNPLKARLETDSKLTALQSQNVLGLIKGKTHPDSVIIVCAHYDHLGQVSEAIFAGANDNGAGVAMLLSMADHFSQPEYQPNSSMLFIAFGGEETGLVGSGYYVNHAPAVPLTQTKFVLNLDLMSNGDKGITAVGGKDYPTYFSSLVDLNDSLEMVPVVRARKNAPNSDHYFFLQRGVPGFFIYTLGGPPHYHDVHDVLANQEFSRYAEVRYLLLRFLEEVDSQ